MINTQPTPEQVTPSEAPVKPEDKKTELDPLILKAIQSAEDRVRTEKTKVIKDLEEKVDALTKQSMTEKQLREYETRQKDEALRQKEIELTEKELKLLAIDKLKEAELPLEFVDSVIGKDKDATIGRVSTFKTLWQKALDASVNDRMKAAGRAPAKGRVDGETSGFQGMTAKEIQTRAHNDPKWFAANEKEILAAMQRGEIKR